MELKNAVGKGLKNCNEETGEIEWKEEDSFEIKLECRLNDKLSNKQDVPQGRPQKCAYVKLINVPSLLDIGGNTPDPTDENLTLSMIDYPTLEKIS